MPREHEWDSRWWSPDHQRRAPRDARARRRHRPDRVRDLRHRRARCARRRCSGPCVAQCDVAVGKVIYTPVLDAKGGFRSDLTVMRLGDDHFRVVTGGAHGMADRKWFADHLADGAAARRPDRRRSPRSGCGGRGPATSSAALTDDDISPRGLRRSSPAARSRSAASTVLASRISYVGELGWELYVADGAGAPGCGTLLLEAGSAARRRARSASASTAPPAGIEKGYRAYGFELDAERTIVEAGMQRPKVKAADFVGREAYLAQRDDGAADGAVHADRRRPHLGGGREALHARRRADPAPATAAR